MRAAIPSIWRGLGNGWGKQLLLTAVLTCGVSFPDRGNAQAQETGGIGGTGIGQETGGIGGTGITPETGGIGGTGLHKLDVPIVGYGTVQSCGKHLRKSAGIWREKHFAGVDPGLRRLLPPASRRSRGRHGAIGPRGGVAQEISVLNAIIGPVSAVSGAGSSAIVLGQELTSAGREPLFAGIRPGDVVAVSAQLQFSGSWSARRVAMLPSMGHFQLVAPLSAVGTGSLSFRHRD